MTEYHRINQQAENIETLKFDVTSCFDIDSKSAKLAQEAKEISDMIEQIKKQALLNQMANSHDETEVSS